MSVADVLDRLLIFVPDGHVPVRLVLTRQQYDELVEEPNLSDVTLVGDDVPLNRAYARDFPERLTWHDVQADWSGSTTVPAWEITREILEHARTLKQERGIRLYRGIPVEVGDETCLRWERIERLAEALALTGGAA